MAPPTGINRITIYVWRQAQNYLACHHACYSARPVRGESIDEVVEQLKERLRQEFRAWLELHEPYYVEALLEHYTEFEVNFLDRPCHRCLPGWGPIDRSRTART